MNELTTIKPEVDIKSYNLALSLLSKSVELKPEEIIKQKTHLVETEEPQSLNGSLGYIIGEAPLRTIYQMNFASDISELKEYFETVPTMLISLGVIGEYLMKIKTDPTLRGSATPPFTGEGWDISEERENEILTKMEAVREDAKKILNGQTYLINKSDLVEHFPELLIEVCRQKVASVTT